MRRFLTSCVFVMVLITCVIQETVSVDYNTCSGGLGGAKTCTVDSTSHCCTSGFWSSASCCRNSCSYPVTAFGFLTTTTTTTCQQKTESRCCSKYSDGTKSCCNFAQFSQTSTSSINGLYPRILCSGSTIYTCTNHLSTHCCGLGFQSYGCCSYSQRTCSGPHNPEEYCSEGSKYCCTASKSSSKCCGLAQYSEINSEVGGGIALGVIGAIVFLILLIALPAVACGAFAAAGSNVGGTIIVGNPNSVQPNPQYYQQNPGYQQHPGYQPPPGYQPNAGYNQPQAAAPQPTNPQQPQPTKEAPVITPVSQ